MLSLQAKVRRWTSIPMRHLQWLRCLPQVLPKGHASRYRAWVYLHWEQSSLGGIRHVAITWSFCESIFHLAGAEGSRTNKNEGYIMQLEKFSEIFRWANALLLKENKSLQWQMVREMAIKRRSSKRQQIISQGHEKEEEKFGQITENIVKWRTWRR